MNEEQKQRAADLLSAWQATAYALHGDRMANLLQELMDAPEVLAATNPAQISSSAEPVLVVETEPGYWNRGHYYEGTKSYIDPTKVWGLPAGTKLYTAPPAPSVPDGWRELCHRLYVELFHCDKQMTNTRDEDGEPVWRTGATVRAVLDEAKAALDSTPTPAEPPADVARDAERYRWLRNPEQEVGLVLDKRVGFREYDEGTRTGGYPIYEYRSGEELDAAIDAAIKRQGGE